MPWRYQTSDDMAWTTLATCSNVICGFFPPKPIRLTRQDEHRDSRAQPMSNEARVRPDFEVTEPGLLLGAFKPLLDVPSSECNTKHLDRRRPGRRVAQEVLDLVGRRIPGDHQPVLAFCWTRCAAGGIDQMHAEPLDLPDYFAACHVLDFDALPRLPGEQRAMPAHVIHALGGVGWIE